MSESFLGQNMSAKLRSRRVLKRVLHHIFDQFCLQSQSFFTLIRTIKLRLDRKNGAAGLQKFCLGEVSHNWKCCVRTSSDQVVIGPELHPTLIFFCEKKMTINGM